MGDARSLRQLVNDSCVLCRRWWDRPSKLDRQVALARSALSGQSVPVVTDESRLEVYLARRRGLGVGVALGVLIAAMTFFLEPLCAIGFIAVAIILVRFADPRPQLVLDASGVLFGGLCKVALWHDVYVPWQEIEAIGSVETPDFDVKVTKSMSMAPRWVTSWQSKVIPMDTFDVMTTTGRRFRVCQPGRGLTLEQVRAELLSRMERVRP